MKHSAFCSLPLALTPAMGTPSFAQTAPPAFPAYGAPLTLEMAKKAMAAAESEALKQGWPVAKVNATPRPVRRTALAFRCKALGWAPPG